MRAPRKQAHRLTEWLTRDQPSLRGVLLGARREGKSDLLAQTHHLLFESAEGPLPFWFRFEPAPEADASAITRQALRFTASFCQQMRAFLLRQEELLAEPPGDLPAEMERPGVPLALNELSREVVAGLQGGGAAAALLEMVSRLPGRFAHREGRPVCLLWDDCHLLPAGAAYLAALESTTAGEGRTPQVCSLLTGFAPAMRTLLGQRCFTALALEPFAASEALLLAESACKASGVRFNRRVWECWFATAGTSPGWAVPLIEAAGLRGEPLETIEQLGRTYATELESGSFANWLGARWPLPLTARPRLEPDPQALATRLADRAVGAAPRTGESAHPGMLTTEDPAQSLHRREWLRLHPFTAEDILAPVEADWLRLETDRAVMGSARAKARLLQNLILRTHRRQTVDADGGNAGELSLDALEEHLLYPASPDRKITSPSGDEVRLPDISSVVREATPEAELYWCFGETLTINPGRKSGAAGAVQSLRTAVVMLLACPYANPAKPLVSEWALRLQQEIIRDSKPADKLSTQLWVVVPAGASMAPTGQEVRINRQMLTALLTAGEQDAQQPQAAQTSPSPAAAAGLASTSQPAVEEIGKRLAELQARTHMLQQEFRSARTKAPATSTQAAATVAPGTGGAQDSPIDRRNEYLRQALSLSLMLASADLVATGSSGAAGTTEARQSLSELQLQCQQLLEQLHAQAASGQNDSPAMKVKPFPPARS